VVLGKVCLDLPTWLPSWNVGVRGADFRELAPFLRESKETGSLPDEFPLLVFVCSSFYRHDFKLIEGKHVK